MILFPEQRSIGSILGHGLAQGIGKHLVDIAESKVRDLSANQTLSRTAKELQGLDSRLTPEDAFQFAKVPEAQRYSAINDYLSQLGTPTQVGEVQPAQQAMQQLQGGQAPSPVTTEPLGALKELFGNNNQLPQGQMGRGLQEGSLDSILRQALTRDLVQPQQQAAPLSPPPGTAPERNLPKPPVQPEPQPQPKKPLSAQEFLAQRQLAPASALEQLPSAQLEGETNVQYAKRLQAERKEQLKQAAEEEKAKKKDINEGNKETKKFYDTTNGEAKAALNNNLRLNRMEQLIDRADLNSPSTVSFVRTLGKIPWFGVDLSSLLTADTQEFEKISKDFLKDAKAIFGSRITDVDLQNFLKTVPDLIQSDEGKLAVIRDLKLMNDGALVRSQAMNQIIRENGGNRPRDLEELVSIRTKPQLDALSEEFIRGEPKKAKTATEKMILAKERAGLPQPLKFLNP
jgi:hypothetical protein